MATFEVNTSESRAIQLQLNGPDIILAAEDVDRFVRNSPWVTSTYSNVLELGNFIQRFQAEFLVALRQWCAQYQQRVRAGFVPFPSQHLQAFVVSRSKTYDFELSDPIADLEMALFEKGWNAEILQIPLSSPESRRHFFDESESIQFYGDVL